MFNRNQHPFNHNSIPRKTVILGTTALGLLGATLFSDIAVAQSCASITTLTNGTNANASTVMDNFNTIRNCVNTLQSGGTLASPTLSGTTTLPGSGRISSAGFLGLGMTPGTILDITQNQNAHSLVSILNSNGGTAAGSAFRTTNGTSSAVLFQWGSGYTTSGINRQNGTLLYGDGAGGLTLASLAAQPIYFATNTAERMRIDSAGNVGIGATGPAVKLQVVGDIRVGTSGTNGCIQQFAGTALTGTCSSDERLKTVTGRVSGVLDRLTSLNLVNFHWNETAARIYKYSTEAKNTGFTAQSVQGTFPELVSMDEHGYKLLDYTTLQLYGLEAIKELKATSDNQAAEIETLQRQVSELRQRAGIQTAGGDSFFQRVASVIGWK